MGCKSDKMKSRYKTKYNKKKTEMFDMDTNPYLRERFIC